VREVADLLEGLRSDHGPDRDRIGGVEHLARLIRREKGVHDGLLGYVDALDRVGQDEAVHAHHYRDAELFGQAECLDVEVRRFLVGLGEQLDPARIPDRHGIAVIVPDVDRCAIARLASVMTMEGRDPLRCRRPRA